jgi:selenocysteine lyase/cysteine desulfurase
MLFYFMLFCFLVRSIECLDFVRFRIDMNPVNQEPLDGVFLSPHKFAGGPQTPGVLVLKRKIFDL